jgi:hypothetical protein
MPNEGPNPNSQIEDGAKPMTARNHGGEKSDAKTHRTPKALRAKSVEDRCYFVPQPREFRSACASSRRFEQSSDIVIQLSLLETTVVNHGVAF